MIIENSSKQSSPRPSETDAEGPTGKFLFDCEIRSLIKKDKTIRRQHPEIFYKEGNWNGRVRIQYWPVALATNSHGVRYLSNTDLDEPFPDWKEYVRVENPKSTPSRSVEYTNPWKNWLAKERKKLTELGLPWPSQHNAASVKDLGEKKMLSEKLVPDSAALLKHSKQNRKRAPTQSVAVDQSDPNKHRRTSVEHMGSTSGSIAGYVPRPLPRLSDIPSPSSKRVLNIPSLDSRSTLTQSVSPSLQNKADPSSNQHDTALMYAQEELSSAVEKSPESTRHPKINHQTPGIGQHSSEISSLRNEISQLRHIIEEGSDVRRFMEYVPEIREIVRELPGIRRAVADVSEIRPYTRDLIDASNRHEDVIRTIGETVQDHQQHLISQRQALATIYNGLSEFFGGLNTTAAQDAPAP